VSAAVKNKDILRDFYDRRHPGFHAKVGHWTFLKQTYQGGREWFASNVFKFHKEGKDEFADRVARAYRFNHTREAVDLVQKYLFKGAIARNEDNAPEVVKQFWKATTLSNLPIDQLMRIASTGNSIFGRVAIFVDNNMPPEGAVTLAEVKRSGVKIYAYMVTAQDLLDYAWDEDGDGGLLWVKVREYARDDRDPLNSSGETVERVRLWTRTEWRLYEEVEKKGRGGTSQLLVQEIASGTHDLGVVPCVFVDHNLGSDPYEAPGLIDDIAYLDRAVANYLSNLDAIIQDQTFSQLAMPAQGVLPGEDAYSKVVDMGTKRVFIYDGGPGSSAKPEYLAPDPKQAGVILTVINKIINEIYHTIGLAGERTKEDNAVGIDNSSGVAKAYDFERVNSLLRAKALSCENAENELVKLVCLWAKEKAPAEKLVRYPESFDVMRLADELAVAEQLAKIQAPIEVRREQMRIVTDKLFARLAADVQARIKTNIDDWLEGTDDPDLLFGAPTSFAGKPATARPRQGQVTKDTPSK
jgi:hypothetical protein